MKRIVLGSIIGVFCALAGLFVYQRSGTLMCGFDIWAQADMSIIAKQLDHYKERNGSYPTTEQGLQVLATASDPSDPTHSWMRLLHDGLLDPWHRPYVYRFPSARSQRTFDLFSIGTDGIESKDDVRLSR